MISADEALERLRDGNRRYTSGEQIRTDVAHNRISELASGQAPFAIVLGCSDSRVPAELVFAQGLGDLFVIRVAGNIVAPSQIGSIEFAAAQFGTPLVVILGHSHCGAVGATLEQMQKSSEGQSPNLQAIVSRIRPGLEDVIAGADGQDPERLMQAAVRANVEASIRQLREGSQIVRELLETGGLRVVGAEYDLGSGAVDFFAT